MPAPNTSAPSAPLPGRAAVEVSSGPDRSGPLQPEDALDLTERACCDHPGDDDHEHEDEPEANPGPTLLAMTLRLRRTPRTVMAVRT